MAEFSCTTHVSPGLAVIHAAGDLDLASADRLWAGIAAHLGTGTRVVLECAAVTFCDSAGLQVLLRAHKRAAGSGSFALSGAGGALARVLEITGLTGRIPSVETSFGGGRRPADHVAADTAAHQRGSGPKS